MSIAHSKCLILIHIGGKFVEESPYTRFATAQIIGSVGIVGFGKAEILVFSFEVALFARQIDHVRRIKAVFGIIELNLLYTSLIGMCGNSIVRNTHSYPNGTFLARALADHLQNPNFILIRNAKALAATPVAVGCHQIGHYLYRFACTFGALQSYIDKATVVD